jgi:hypothetical protein
MRDRLKRNKFLLINQMRAKIISKLRKKRLQKNFLTKRFLKFRNQFRYRKNSR